MNAFTFLIDAAHTWPDKPAIVGSSFSLTFSQVLNRAEELRDELVANGIGAKSGLGLIARNSPEFVIGLFAGLAAGAVVMPISHHLKEAELRRILDLVPVAGLLHDGSLKHEMGFNYTGASGGFFIGSAPRIGGALTRSRPVACGVENPAVVRFTSGTTGASKGVVLSHESVAARSMAAIEGLRLTAGDRVTWVLPMAYHFIVSILTYIRYGVTVVLPDDNMPAAILDSTEEFGSSLIYASPLIVQMLAADQSGRMLPAATRVISTSSGLTAANAAAFELRYAKRVSQVYGVIEVGLPIGNIDNTSLPPAADSLGAALPHYEAAVLDNSGERCARGEMGRLAVRGPGMFDAYLTPFTPRADVLLNGWFLTGDLAVEDSSSRLTVCGREKSVINTAGNKVFPEEVEGVLTSFPGVRAARAFGREHPLTGEVVAAEIVPTSPLADSSHGLDLEALRRYCYERLSPYKVPKEIKVVSSLPTTDSGKIVRAA